MYSRLNHFASSAAAASPASAAAVRICRGVRSPTRSSTAKGPASPPPAIIQVRSTSCGLATPFTTRLIPARTQRDQKCVDDVAGLLLVKGDWNHADPFGKGDHAVKRLVIGSRVAHDLGNVVSPDATGEEERKKPFGPIRELRKHARKKRRRIGCEYRRLGRDNR